MTFQNLIPLNAVWGEGGEFKCGEYEGERSRDMRGVEEEESGCVLCAGGEMEGGRSEDDGS